MLGHTCDDFRPGMIRSYPPSRVGLMLPTDPSSQLGFTRSLGELPRTAEAPPTFQTAPELTCLKDSCVTLSSVISPSAAPDNTPTTSTNGSSTAPVFVARFLPKKPKYSEGLRGASRYRRQVVPSCRVVGSIPKASASLDSWIYSTARYYLSAVSGCTPQSSFPRLRAPITI
jgi:hypothetical protein